MVEPPAGRKGGWVPHSFGSWVERIVLHPHTWTEGVGRSQTKCKASSFLSAPHVQWAAVPEFSWGQLEYVPFVAGPKCACEQMDEDLANFYSGKTPLKGLRKLLYILCCSRREPNGYLAVCTVLWWIRYFYCFSKIHFLCKDSSVRFSVIPIVLLWSWGGKDLFSQGK